MTFSPTEQILTFDPAIPAEPRGRRRLAAPIFAAKADAADVAVALADKASVAELGAAILQLIGTAPETLNTLGKIAAAIGENPDFAGMIIDRLLEKQDSTLAPGALGSGTVARSLVDKISEQPVSPEDYGAAGGGVTDDAPAFAAMLSSVATTKRPIRLRPVIYRLANTSPVRLPDGLCMYGSADRQGVSRLDWRGSGAAMFDSDPNAYMSALNISNMEILCGNNAAGNIGTGDAIKLYGLCNNSRISNVLIRNFPGNAITIAKQTLNPSDATACGNVLFSQVFVVSCGGYAFDVDGRVNAIWSMCDYNSCATGGYRFRSGISNQAQITIIGQWWEGTQPWSATNVIKFDNPSGQVLNLLGGTFQNDIAGSNRYLIDNVGASTPVINMEGVSRYGFDADYHDGVNSVIYNDGDRGIFSAHGSIAGAALKAVGIGPTIELFQNSGGTANQRRFREGVAGNLLAKTARNDDGSAARTLMTLAHNTGAVNFPNPTTLSINSVQVLGQRKTGWSLPTGALSRATFDPATVTHEEGMRILAALITDFISHHGSLGT